MAADPHEDDRADRSGTDSRPDPGTGPAPDDVAGTVEFTPPAPEPREYVVPGIVVGLLAWGVGYVLTLGLGFLFSALSLLSVTGTDATLHVGFYLYSSAHSLPLELAGTRVGANLLVGAGLVSLVFVLVPLAVVVAAAVLVVNRVGVPGPREGALAGAAVTLGYVLPALAAVVVVVPLSFSVGDTLFTVEVGALEFVVVGLLYPAVVGGVTGVVASL